MEPSIFQYSLMFILPLVATLLLTPCISRLAIHAKIVDMPGLHKTHTNPRPLLGGLAIFISFSVILLIFIPFNTKILSLLAATIVIVVTGLWDDIRNIKPGYKLFGQTIAASIVVLSNVESYAVLLNYFKRFYLPEFIVLGLIIGWIVLMINAFNLIDGLDGLAVGTAAIIFFSMAAISIMEGGRPVILGVQLIGAGACLGFLVFNFNPARIFMGDIGSMLLGFILATTHLFTIDYPFSTAMVLGSMFIFAYPALDVGYAIYRRLCRKNPLFKADKGHIHHVLLSLGFSVRKVVSIIYLANFFFTLMAIMLLGLSVRPLVVFFIGILTAFGVIMLFRRLLIISEKNGVG
ncbi:MAG TPA: MraY family glycosyltransferase [Acidobacteriota bacterium]|nr:MraY family glycosyltransferase [Acidobacteriota bacterium]